MAELRGTGVSPPAESSSLFDFGSGPGDRSLGSIWTAPSSTGRDPVQTHWLSGARQPRPHVGSFSVPKDVMGGATEKIRKSLAALDDVVSVTPTSRTPGSLLKESFRVDTTSYVGMGSHTETPHTGTPSQFGTPQTLSIMDEHGLLRELILTEEPDVTVMNQTPLPSTGQGQRSDDPGEETSRELVMSFHRCYSSHFSPAQSLELAAELQQACQDQISAAMTNYPSETKLLSELALERSTWELVEVLYTDRLEEEAIVEDMDTMVLTGQSHREIADEYFVKDSTVRQAQVVVDWLEKNSVSRLDKYPTKVNYFADSVCWENTLYSIERRDHPEGLVTEMDPDAPRRQDKHLADLDEKDEQSLLKHLFTCIRAGQVAKAQELCVQCGQSWRAATLEGWRLHHDPNYGKNLLVDDVEAVEGNVSRDLWKVCAWGMAADPKLSLYERAVYAALSGNVKQILPACNSWLDYVWAYFKVMVDVLTEQRLRGSSHSTDPPLEPLPPEYWNTILVPELIMQEIEACPNAVVSKLSNNPFHVVQKFLILGDLDGLVGVMHEWLQEQVSLYQLRFMAHLVLFAQGLSQASAEDERCSDILQAYVKSLTDEDFHKCVALYTSRLPHPLQVTCYASLLEGIVDPGEQRECLELGSEAGLDIAVITKSVVEHMRNTGPEEGASMLGPELVPQMDTEITKLDRSKIEVIRWLIFDKGQRSEAIRQGNALMRQFLATRKLSAADALFRKLPADSVGVVQQAWAAKAGESPLPADLANDIHEYHCIQAYLECHVTFNEWFHHYHHNKPESPPEPSDRGFKDSVAYEHKLKQYQIEERVWQNQLTSLSEDVETCLYRVLMFEGGWMVDPFSPEEVDQRRARQLVLLREICIPQVTFLLHTILDTTQQTKKCLQLVDIVASEDYQLYKVFRQHELERLLSLLNKSALASLTDRQSELGYPL